MVRERLEWLLDWAEHGSVSHTCRRFGIARTTFYRWARRFDAADLSTLQDLPTRPDLAARAAAIDAPAPVIDALSPVAQPECAAQPSPVAAPIDPPVPAAHPAAEVRHAVRRGMLIFSVAANLLLLASLLAIALWQSAPASPRIQADVSSPAPLHP